MTRILLLALVLLAFPFAKAESLDTDPRTGKESHVQQPADLVVTNGQIYLVDAVRGWAQALAVYQGKIVFIGNNKQAQSFIGPDTKQLNLNGQMVLPGFHDCHTHPIDSGTDLAHCNLDEIDTRQACLKAISDYVRRHSTDEWILGCNWSLPLFKDANPSKSDLDALIPDRPAYFLSQDAHSCWVNSKALALAGITKTTANPPLGKIERDVYGEPTGTLRESAVDLVSNLVPKPTKDELMAGLQRALQMARSFGITSIQDAHTSEEFLQTYRRAEMEGTLTVHVVAALSVNLEDDVSQVKDLVALRDKYTTAMLHPTSAKIFADGVIESHTAALFQPYVDQPQNRGILNLPQDQFNSLVCELDRCGFQVHVHAIGDQAINEALNSFAEALARNGRTDNRHQIAHLELLKPADIPRFRQLGVIANVQPFWAFNDKYMSECTTPLLGAKRSGHLYPIHSLMKSGAIVAAGSDWSVSTMNPVDAMEVAVTRCGPERMSRTPFIPDERVDLYDIIASYTISGAYANHEEQSNGSLEVGKEADFIVLDRNLFQLPASEIHKAKVLWTFLHGKPVFKRDGAPALAGGLVK